MKRTTTVTLPVDLYSQAKAESPNTMALIRIGLKEIAQGNFQMPPADVVTGPKVHKSVTIDTVAVSNAYAVLGKSTSFVLTVALYNGLLTWRTNPKAILENELDDNVRQSALAKLRGVIEGEDSSNDNK